MLGLGCDPWLKRKAPSDERVPVSLSPPRQSQKEETSTDERGTPRHIPPLDPWAYRQLTTHATDLPGAPLRDSNFHKEAMTEHISVNGSGFCSAKSKKSHKTLFTVQCVFIPVYSIMTLTEGKLHGKWYNIKSSQALQARAMESPARESKVQLLRTMWPVEFWEPEALQESNPPSERLVTTRAHPASPPTEEAARPNQREQVLPPHNLQLRGIQRWGAGDWNRQDHFVRLNFNVCYQRPDRPIQNQGSRNKVLDTLTIPLATTGITFKNN